MTHHIALYGHSHSDNSRKIIHDKSPDCNAELKFEYRGFWDDISWSVYRCPGCEQRIACVDGGVHWWNYVIKPKAEAA